MKLSRGIWLLAGMCMALTVTAGEAPRYNQVNLEAEVSELVGNDTMHVSMNSFGEARDPAALASRPLHESTARLLDLSLERGASDNVTLILVEAVPAPAGSNGTSHATQQRPE